MTRCFIAAFYILKSMSVNSVSWNQLHQLHVRFGRSPEFRCNGSQPVETFLVTPANTAGTRKVLLNFETFLLSPVDSFVLKIGTDEVIPIPPAPSTISKSFNERSDVGLCFGGRVCEKKSVRGVSFSRSHQS